MFLAEVTTDFQYQWVGWLFVGLAAVAMCANQIDDFLDRRKTKAGEPPNETLHADAKNLVRRVDVLEEDVSEISQRMIGSDWFRKIESDIKYLKDADATYRENKDRADSIHRKSLYEAIKDSRDETREEISELRQAISDDRKEIDTKIQELPNQLVAMLRNTGVIK
jgi:hypothetical protein